MRFDEFWVNTWAFDCFLEVILSPTHPEVQSADALDRAFYQLGVVFPDRVLINLGNDLERMMKTPIAKEALQDTELYNAVIEHRRKFIGLRGFDYNTLQPDNLNILPPTPEIEQLWKEEYRRMRDTMIYGESVEFDELIKMMRVLMGICNEN